MMDARLKRIKELFLESEKRNGELAHENFELKKRIAELEEIGIVHCKDCIYFQKGWTKCKMLNLNGADGDWYCASGERKGAK